ncbi:MAG: helix-turn-helix domain-containing protein [Candidatus Spechtbacterales bacterium]|nr:helix-turn-helix domain-containing protein [Candidatus Spechtbacterales bacterium]
MIDKNKHNLLNEIANTNRDGKTLSLKEASKISGYHRDYLGQLIRNDKIHGFKRGGSWFTTQKELYSYLHRKKPEHLVQLIDEGAFDNLKSSSENKPKPKIMLAASGDSVAPSAPPEDTSVEEEKIKQVMNANQAEDETQNTPPKREDLRFLERFKKLFTLSKKRNVAALGVGVLAVIMGVVGAFALFFGDNSQQETQTQTESEIISIAGLNLAEINIAERPIKNIIANGFLEINGPVAIRDSSRPDNPQAGQIYFDQDDNQLYLYDGESWVSFFVEGPEFFDEFITSADIAGLATDADIATLTADLDGKVNLNAAPTAIAQDGYINITATVFADAFSGSRGSFSSGDAVVSEELILVDSTDTTSIQPVGINIQSTGAGITTGIDLTDTGIETAIALGDNPISVTGATISASELALLSGRSGTLIDSNNVGDFTITGIRDDFGLELSEAGEAGLIANCNSGELLKWNGTGWQCDIDIDTTGGGSNDTLQTAYNRGNILTTTDDNNILFNLADTTTDSDFIVDLQGTGNVFEVQDAGTGIFTVSDSGSASVNGTFNLALLDCTGNIGGGALTTDGSGNVVCSDDDGGAGSFAPTGAEYVVVSLDGTLTNERALTVNTTNLALTDGGANGNITINTIQDIDTTATPTFATLTLGDDGTPTQGSLILHDNTGANTFTGTLQTAANLTADRTYTLPDTDGEISLLGQVIENGELQNSSITVTAGNGLANGGSVALGGSTTLDITSGNGGIVVNADDITLTLATASDGLSATTSSGSGLEVLGSGLTLLQGCANSEVLKWNETSDTWECAGDAGGSNAFETINTPSGTNPVADSTTDTLNFTVTGTNLTITGEEATDTLDFDIDESVLAGAGLAVNGDALDVSAGNGIQIDTDAVALGALTANWNQTGAFDIVLNNSSSELQILDSDGTHSVTLDVGNLTSNATYQFVDPSGGAGTYDICTTDGNCTGAGGAAPSDAEYLVLAADADLTAERIFNPGTSLSFTDNGAGSNYDLDTIQDIRTTATPTFATLTLGDDGTPTQGSLILHDNTGANTFTGTLQTVANLSASRTYTLPDEDGTVCTTGSVCSGYQASGSYFEQGGNSFGALAQLGTTDSNDLAILANSTEVARFGTNGNFGIGTSAPGEGLTVGGGSSALVEDGFFTTPFGGFGRYENYLTHSEELDDADWTKNGISVTPGVVTSPDSLNTADAMVDDLTGGGSLEQVETSATDSQDWTFSIWLRGTGSQDVSIEIEDDGTPGTTTNNVTLSTSWRRYSVTHTTTAGTTQITARINHTSTASDTIYGWGAQLERKSTAGVYAQTETSTITTTGRGFIARSNGPHIFTDGNVGIGTINPNYSLHINDTSPILKLEDNVSATASSILSLDTNAKDWQIRSVAPSGNFLIRNDTNSLDAITITPTGSVGIGIGSPNGLLDISKSLSGATSNVGKYLSISSSEFTDNNTSSSGTSTRMAFNSIAQPTLSAVNTNVTTTDVATFYIADAPAEGTNQTITNPYALWIDAGDTRLDGGLTVANELNANGNVFLGDGSADQITISAVVQGSNALVFDGSTPDANRTTLSVVNPSTLRTVTIPDASGTICLEDAANCGFATVASGTGSAFTDGSIVFSDSNGDLTEDNSNLFWDNSNNFLGIGINAPASRLEINGDITANAWGTQGIIFDTDSATFTDDSTATLGTAASAVFNSFQIPTLASSNTNVTTTDASTVYIAGAPTAGANQTITNPYALWVDAGNARFDGNIGVSVSTPSAKLDILQASTSTTADTLRGQLITVNDTGAVASGTDITYGSRINVTRTGATGGTIDTYGQYIDITGDNAGAGTHTATGLYVDVSNSNADNQNAAIFNGNVGIGVDPSGNDFQIHQGSVSNVFIGEGGTLTTDDWIELKSPGSNADPQLVIHENNEDAGIEITSSSGTWDSFIRFTDDGSNVWTIGRHDPDAGPDPFKISFNSDFGTNDYFTVLTDGNIGIGATAPSSHLEIDGDITANAWGTEGIILDTDSATFTDDSTAGSGTAASAVFNSFQIPTLAATNSSVTTTDAATFYIAGAPTAGANQTITNPYALWVDAGSSRFDGRVIVDATTGSSTSGLCWSGSAGSAQIEDCNGAPTDLAENFGTGDVSIEAGDIVVVSGEAQKTKVGGLNTSKAYVEKSSEPYQVDAIGVVSTDPNQIYGTDGLFENEDNPRPVSLAGRVPVKVTNENGSIKAGDYITTSSIPGVGMRASEAGRVIGIALESFTATEEFNLEDPVIGNIIVFVNPTWHVPGDVIKNIASNTDTDFETTNNENPTSLENVSSSMLANLQDLFRVAGMRLKDGVVAMRELFIDRLTTRELVIDSEPPTFKQDSLVGDGVLRFTENNEEYPGTNYNNYLVIDKTALVELEDSDGIKAIITNDNIKNSSKVFITLKGDYSPATRYWVNWNPGEFSINFNSMPEQDIEFSWWVVQTNQDETEQASNTENSTSQEAPEDENLTISNSDPEAIIEDNPTDEDVENNTEETTTSLTDTGIELNSTTDEEEYSAGDVGELKEWKQ